MISGSEFEIDHTGEYVELDPPRRLVFTGCTSETDGATTLVPTELDAEGQRATNLREGCLALLDRHAAAPCAR